MMEWVWFAGCWALLDYDGYILVAERYMPRERWTSEAWLVRFG